MVHSRDTPIGCRGVGSAILRGEGVWGVPACGCVGSGEYQLEDLAGDARAEVRHLHLELLALVVHVAVLEQLRLRLEAEERVVQHLDRSVCV